MANISALLGGQTDEEKRAAMTQALRGQQTMGNILSLSPDQYINKLGSGLASSAQEGAATAGKRRADAIAAQQLAKQKRQASALKATSLAGHRRDQLNRRKPQNFYDHENPTDQVSALLNQQGIPLNPEKAERIKGMVHGLPKATGNGKGSGGAAANKDGMKADKNIESAVDSIDLMEKILMDDGLGSSTGWGTATKWLAEKGWLFDGGDRQSLTKRMGQVTMASIAKNLEPLGINPTDLDLMLAKAPLPDIDTQPEGWVNWIEDFKEGLATQIKRSRAAGRTVATDAEFKQYTDRLDSLHKRASAKWKKRNPWDKFWDNPNFKGSGLPPTAQGQQANAQPTPTPQPTPQPTPTPELQALMDNEARIKAEIAELDAMEATP